MRRSAVLALLLAAGLPGCGNQPRPPLSEAEVEAAHERHWRPAQQDVREAMEAGNAGPTRDPAALEQGRANRLPETWWQAR